MRQNVTHLQKKLQKTRFLLSNRGNSDGEQIKNRYLLYLKEIAFENGSDNISNIVRHYDTMSSRYYYEYKPKELQD